MSKSAARELFVLSVEDVVASQLPDGDCPQAFASHLSILPMAICYSENFPGNRFYKSPKLLDSLVRLGDFNDVKANAKGVYDGPVPGWDEWRTLAWLDAMQLIKSDLDSSRLNRWMDKIGGFAGHIVGMIPNLDDFDGLVPNHPMWDYALLNRMGHVFGEGKYIEEARGVFSGVFAAQTPDGLFREGGSHAGFPGTAVTGYNMVSACAIDYYGRESGDARAMDAVERAWRWYYDFLLPDGGCFANLDIRMHGWLKPQLGLNPSAWLNKPEGAFTLNQAIEQFHQRTAKHGRHTPSDNRVIGFLAFQYPGIAGDVPPRAPVWPERHRMIAQETGVRRRNGWASLLTGMDNRFISNVMPSLYFGHERQDCVGLHHEKAGPILGSAHSRMDSRFSTFAVYGSGCAQYVADDAFYRSTPTLDTLLLQYGADACAVTVDSRQAAHCDVVFSLDGARGSRTVRGPGHAMSALGARAHASVHLDPGGEIRLGERRWSVDRPVGESLSIRVPKGEVLDLGLFKLVSPDLGWEFQWPVHAVDPYTQMNPGHAFGVVEFVLHRPKQTTCTLRVMV